MAYRNFILPGEMSDGIAEVESYFLRMFFQALGLHILARVFWD